MSVSATSTPVTEASKEEEVALARIPCIHYPLRFQKDTNKVQALIDIGSKVNAMAPAYVLKLGLQVCQTDVGVQKIDDSAFETFEMVLANF